MILTKKEVKALRVLGRLPPTETDWQVVMSTLKSEAGIGDEAEAEEVVASLEAHGLLTCDKRQTTPSYTTQAVPQRTLFRASLTSRGLSRIGGVR